MMDKKVMYETLLNEHRRLTNQIADIKANSYELSDEDKKQVDQLQRQQVYLMKKMESLF
jgi:hypothetical protein